MIALRNLEKSYSHGVSKTFVLRQIDIDVKEGEFLSIMGPSGAGKSTLLHILGMHDSAWSGEFEFHGYAVHAMKPKERAKLHKQYIGFVFQSYHLLDDLTVYENLEIPLSYRNVSRSERDSIVCDSLDRFRIRSLSQPTVRWSAAARGRCSRRDRQPQAHSRGRANRQSPHGTGAGNHGAVHPAQPGRHDNHPGDALGGECRLRAPCDPAS